MDTPPSSGVRAEGIGKRYDDLWALRDLDLDVPAGTVLGLLGHNGAGKTTAIRILTTISTPTTGRAVVAGFDTSTHAVQVRERIGVTAQQATVDDLMSAEANLVMIGRLHDLSKAGARRRAHDLLEQFDLTDAGSRLVKTFSGGMRRRLDLAASLVATPEVLFLDEPTTGLDPTSRTALWDTLRSLTQQGCTIVLTTQYLEEADRLADDVVVLDHGRTVAHGSPAELKAQIGDERADITLRSADELDAAVSVTRRLASGQASVDRDARCVTVPLADGVRLIDIMRCLDDAGIDALDLNRREATLDDVFIALTSPSDRRSTEPEDRDDRDQRMEVPA